MSAEAINININIWDDYHDDGFVPVGEIQETYAYVESDLSDDDCRDVLALLKANIEAISGAGSTLQCSVQYHDSAKVHPELIGTEHEWCLYKRWQLEMKHLTHRARETLVEAFAACQLEHKGVPVVVYSES